MRDFTLQIFKSLCIELKNQGYKFITFSDYCSNNVPAKFAIVRHDVDRKGKYALKIAELESSLGIKSSYYFRCKNGVFEYEIIRKINTLVHEVGYHYENLAKSGGNYPKALEMFEYELNELREIAKIKTICAHGSPLSKWDSRKLWEKYNFRDFGIVGEPNFSVNFDEVLYLTDTGRRWNGVGVSVRDKVDSKFNYNFKSTFDIIKALNKDELPDKLMVNVHPHRWTDKTISWLKELIWQNTKNIMKKHFLAKE